eukprot:bmy_12306T0
MYADDYKNSFIKTDLIYIIFLGTRQMSGFVSFLNKGSMYWSHLSMDTTMGRAYEIICYSEIPFFASNVGKYRKRYKMFTIFFLIISITIDVF